MRCRNHPSQKKQQKKNIACSDQISCTHDCKQKIHVILTAKTCSFSRSQSATLRARCSSTLTSSCARCSTKNRFSFLQLARSRSIWSMSESFCWMRAAHVHPSSAKIIDNGTTTQQQPPSVKEYSGQDADFPPKKPTTLLIVILPTPKDT